MPQITNVKQSVISVLFAVFGLFAAFDIAFLAYSSDYRNFFGDVRDISGVMWRIIPDVVMVLFYGLIHWKIKNGIILPRLMVWHGVLFGLLGFAMCLPWGGYFLAPFSPVGLLYLGSILWSPAGYALSLSVAMVFIAFNVYLIRLGLAAKKS